jgi:hypothetical protein
MPSPAKGPVFDTPEAFRLNQPVYVYQNDQSPKYLFGTRNAQFMAGWHQLTSVLSQIDPTLQEPAR